MRTILCALIASTPLVAQAQPAPPAPAPTAPPAEPAPTAPPAEPAPAATVEAAPAAPPEAAPVDVSASAVVDAPASSPAEEPAGGTGLLLGAKVGGIVPLDGLSPFVQFGIELGYALPPLKRQLAIVVAVDYTQPSTTNEEMDPRVTGGSYTWKLIEQELGVQATLMFRAKSVKPVIPFAGIGPRILFARSKVQDDGAPMISTTREQSTRIGIGVPLGVELPMGPGGLVGEVLLQYGTLDHTATGDAHTGAISLSVGYRAVL